MIFQHFLEQLKKIASSGNDQAGINVWPAHPVIYEINTWAWLDELSRKYARQIDLSSIPEAEWDALSDLGFDVVWLMGVWERSPLGRQIVMNQTRFMNKFQQILQDLQPQDIAGSPYCIRRYVVDEKIDGPEGLKRTRKQLGQRGMKLILDFVPNHVAPDHPWVQEHPEYFIQGNETDLANEPESFTKIDEHIFACGRDPSFPAWSDVLQLNVFHPELRKAVIQTLLDMVDQCDGVRCDMAMLLINTVFERTWGTRAGQKPATEYWQDVIQSVKRDSPNFLFMAEAYWDMEWELQQFGFDYCYDKRLYDRLEYDSAESIRLHLCADNAYQKKLVRFIENHDEPRAYKAFGEQKEQAAAVILSTIPGAKLFHEGQLEGNKIRLPIFLVRRPQEPVKQNLYEFYRTLLKTITTEKMLEGQWYLCERTGWPDNASFLNIIAWYWIQKDCKYLVVINFSDIRSQARIALPWNELKNKIWTISDMLSGQIFKRDGNELVDQGLYVDLEPWSYHLLGQWVAENS